MGVKILRRVDGKCWECYLDDGHIKCLGDIIGCYMGEKYIEITASEFNASTGKKWRVKKDGRVLPYEEKLYLHINGEKYPVFPDDTAEEIEKRINDDLEYAEVTIIMDDKK